MPLTDPAARASRLPVLAALAAAFTGLVNVYSALTPEFRDRVHWLHQVAPRGLVFFAHALALPAGLALLVMSLYLGRRRRRAAQFTVVLLLALGVLNLLKGLDWEEALISWALAGALYSRRSAFTATHTDGRLRTAAVRVGLIWIGAFGAALLVVAVSAHWSISDPDFTVVLREAGAMLALAHQPVVLSHGFGWVHLGVGALGVCALVATGWVLFRPLREPPHLPAADAQRKARELVRAHGVDTLSYFKLRDDLHHLFSADRRAFLSYTIENGVLLVSGNPVGPADAIGALLTEVRSFAEVRGLKLGVVGACEEMAEAWKSFGLRSFYIGDEAIVDTSEFTLEGRKIRKIRQSVTRMTKAGYSAELRMFDTLGPEEIAALEGVSERWRDGAPERGFSMALDSLSGEHEDSAVVLAHDADGRICGFLHFVPTYGRAAASLSFMRRELDTPNGLTEFLVVKAVELLRERGVEEISLNFAAFAKLMHSPESAFERVLGRLAKIFNPYFQIESLYKFNAKFFPRWQPRYLCYEGRGGLVRAAVAAMWAEGQLPKPSLPKS